MGLRSGLRGKTAAARDLRNGVELAPREGGASSAFPRGADLDAAGYWGRNAHAFRYEPAPALFYTPLAQWRNEARYLAVRIAGDPTLVRKALAMKIAAVEPSLLFSDWLTLEERIERGVRNDMATVRLTAGFGLLATTLAGIGVFGALGYLVTTRSHAIAIRLAVGAEPGVVWRGVVREALQLGVLGAGLGGGLAWLLPHWLGSWLLAELRLDWFAVGCAVVVGVLAAVLGGLRPARRAARIDPLVLLKSE